MEDNKLPTNEKGLQRQLSPMHVWAIAFGCVIGWGSFINPGKKFLPNSGVYGTAIAMILGALVMIVIAFSYAYMVPKFPKAGGEFTFTKNCFGKKLAFICGWFLVVAYLTNVPMNSTAIGLIVDGLDGSADILKFGFHYTIAGFEIYMGEMLLAMFILILFGYLNMIGVKKAGIIQTILSSLLVICVFTLCFAGLVSAKANNINMEPVWGFDKSAAMAAKVTTAEISRYAHIGTSGILSAILATFAIAPWAYVGFDAIPQAAEEFNFSFKKVSLIMVVAIVFGCFVYTSNNTVAAAALTNWPDRVMAGEWVLLVAAEELLGTFGKVLIGIGVSCAVLSGIMGFYLASSRLMYSMACEGYLPKWFGIIDETYKTPRNAILFCILISLSGPILGREALGWFVDMSAIGASIGYFFTCASTLVTTRKYADGSVFLKIMASIGIVFSIAFMILQLIPIPSLSGVHIGKESYIMLLIWIILGFIFYAHERKFFEENY
ncbi:MAG: APC family permease [Acidaminococcaceae bacterium]|nr:APC family permease [Acidaminococcaceae bacterium]